MLLLFNAPICSSGANGLSLMACVVGAKLELERTLGVDLSFVFSILAAGLVWGLASMKAIWSLRFAIAELSSRTYESLGEELVSGISNCSEFKFNLIFSRLFSLAAWFVKTSTGSETIF